MREKKNCFGTAARSLPWKTVILNRDKTYGVDDPSLNVYSFTKQKQIMNLNTENVCVRL